LDNQVCFNEWSIRIPKAMDRAAQHGAGHVHLVDTRSNCQMLESCTGHETECTAECDRWLSKQSQMMRGA